MQAFNVNVDMDTTSDHSGAQMARIMKTQPNVMAFYERLRDKHFPDGTTSHWKRKFEANQ